MVTNQPVVLDTCVLINLLATGRTSEMVQAIGAACLVCSAVSSESLYLRSQEPDGKPEAFDITPLFKTGVLSRCDIEEPAEEGLYVSYATELDDGEAMSLAIAQARNLALATDDRKARRVIRENVPQLLVISTAEIVHAWAQEREQDEVCGVVGSILARARFRPPDSDKLAMWWNQLLDT